MIHSYFTTATPDGGEPLYFGMPLPLLLGVCTLAGGIVAALITAVSKKWRTPADDREDRKIGIEADERLLERFQKLLEARDEKIQGLEDRLTEVANKVESLITERNVLIDWIYAAVRVVRELGGVHLLPKPPKGVYIADHPSNQPEEQEAQR
ncbi:membrane protein [Arthrobacter phage Bauer]|uniref:Membrane protein n=1 Tax=Arthrobacter phage Bauer TaxID=2985648 RepID=A0A9E7V2J8_9CAUD|nr:membrane protein [Arthrobacter phage Bauer]UUG69983.1 membrane protein [Arthrobacter phage Zucker]UYM26573.1 membrane protein [Arthrobacter phage Bauer]